MKTQQSFPLRLRWFGRNAGLRPRLVLIVGLAMLAPGALAVLQAVSGYRSSMAILEDNLAKAAQLSANEEVSMISASREILTSLATHPDIRSHDAACRRTLARSINGLAQYSGAAIADSNGVLACTSAPIRKSVSVVDRAWFQAVMRGEPFVVSDLVTSRWLNQQGIVTAVPLVDEQGVIRGGVALFIGLDWLAQRMSQASHSDQGALALLDGKGDVITRERAGGSGSSRRLPDAALLHAHINAQGTQTFRARGEDGTWRLYAISPLLEGRIFAVIGTPVLSAVGPLALQVAWGVMTPLLMWVLAILVVWFGVEYLVVRWITYLERITSAYASGRNSVRPERVAAAPYEIRQLGETFSRMADLIYARESELRDSLNQKEVLVREIHHRVKNNLQLVMSLLNLHARRIRDPRAEEAFAEARSRINALATLHRRLYESDSLQEIDLRWFLEDLCAELRRGGLSRGRHVELVVDSPSAVIGPELAVPLGLLVTEAITNAYKHAFKDRDTGQIRVEVARDTDDKIIVRIRDNGVGFDPKAENHNSVGLGRSLIEAFVRQLRGELETKSDNGTVVEVRFPAPARSEPKRAA